MILLFVFGIFITIVLVGTAKSVAKHWEFLGETDAVRHDARLVGWFVKGVAAPILVWVLFVFTINGGRFPTLPRFLKPLLAHADWIGIVLRVALPAVLVVGSYWAAITAVWLVVHLVIRTEGRRHIGMTTIFWGGLLSPVIGLLLYFCGWYGLGFALLLLLIPIAKEMTAFGVPKAIEPVYARAAEQMKRGNHTKAEMEVIRQLERKEDDYDGWMLLAELYATKYGDLAEAERTVREVGRHPKTTKDQYCRALHRLADWYLTVAKDPHTARRTLEEICRAYPHSPVSDIARRRIDQIPVGGVPSSPDHGDSSPLTA